MAKLTRLLFGGVVGAGLAYLISRKDVRRRLMGGGQSQLMAPGAPRTDMPAAAPVPVRTPVEESEPVDLESRIEETRRQVKEQIEAPFKVPTVESGEQAEATEEPAIAEIPVSEDEVNAGEAPEILMEEEEPSSPEYAVEELEEAEAEALVEAVETNGIQIPIEVEEASEMETEVTSGPEMEAIIGQGTEVSPEPEGLPEQEIDEFADLRMPATGEPTTFEPEINEAAPEPEAGPAPSQIDREEMRRRIDETRARLKAKAFDALVSGETFIEPETGEAEQQQKPSDIGIDSETDEQIDRFLTEEE